MSNVCVIIPTYNEAKNIAGIVTRIREALPQAGVLVVDDNSPDGTTGVVRELAARDGKVSLLVRQSKEGLGKAYLHAFSEVLKDPSVTHIVMMDADFSHDPGYLPTMFEAAAGADFVIGSRYVHEGATEGWEPWRIVLSKYGNWYCRTITGMPVYDATGGFNFISADYLRAMPIDAFDASGYAFQVELKHLLWRMGARFAEIPIIFKNRREGESKISNHIITEGLIAPWKMRFKKK